MPSFYHIICRRAVTCGNRWVDNVTHVPLHYMSGTLEFALQVYKCVLTCYNDNVQ